MYICVACCACVQRSVSSSSTKIFFYCRKPGGGSETVGKNANFEPATCMCIYMYIVIYTRIYIQCHVRPEFSPGKPEAFQPLSHCKTREDIILVKGFGPCSIPFRLQVHTYIMHVLYIKCISCHYFGASRSIHFKFVRNNILLLLDHRRGCGTKFKSPYYVIQRLIQVMLTYN